MVSLAKVSDWEKMMLRLPPGMRERIAEAATASGRSMNAEVIARLQTSFEAPSTETDADFWKTEFEILRENARRYGEVLEEYRRDNTLIRQWLQATYEAQKADKPPPEPPFPLDQPLPEVEFVKR